MARWWNLLYGGSYNTTPALCCFGRMANGQLVLEIGSANRHSACNTEHSAPNPWMPQPLDGAPRSTCLYRAKSQLRTEYSVLRI